MFGIYTENVNWDTPRGADNAYWQEAVMYGVNRVGHMLASGNYRTRRTFDNKELRERLQAYSELLREWWNCRQRAAEGGGERYEVPVALAETITAHLGLDGIAFELADNICRAAGAQGTEPLIGEHGEKAVIWISSPSPWPEPAASYKLCLTEDNAKGAWDWDKSLSLGLDVDAMPADICGSEDDLLDLGWVDTLPDEPAGEDDEWAWEQAEEACREWEKQLLPVFAKALLGDWTRRPVCLPARGGRLVADWRKQVARVVHESSLPAAERRGLRTAQADFLDHVMQAYGDGDGRAAPAAASLSGLPKEQLDLVFLWQNNYFEGTMEVEGSGFGRNKMPVFFWKAAKDGERYPLEDAPAHVQDAGDSMYVLQHVLREGDVLYCEPKGEDETQQEWQEHLLALEQCGIAVVDPAAGRESSGPCLNMGLEKRREADDGSTAPSSAPVA